MIGGEVDACQVVPTDRCADVRPSSTSGQEMPVTQGPHNEELVSAWRLSGEPLAILDPTTYSFLHTNLAWTHLLGWTSADL